MPDPVTNASIERIVNALFENSTAAVCAILASLLTNYWQKQNSRKSIQKQELAGDHTILTETLYVPSGENSVVQMIRNYGAVPLKSIFPDEEWPTISHALMKARKHCTPEEPIVFMHLDKVLNEKTGEFVKGSIYRHWVTYFSGQFNDIRDSYVAQGDKSDSSKNCSVYPVLVFEPNARQKQFRVFLMDHRQLHEGVRLKDKQVLIEGSTTFTHQFDRRDTVTAISSIFWAETHEQVWSKIRVGIKKTSARPSAGMCP